MNQFASKINNEEKQLEETSNDDNMHEHKSSYPKNDINNMLPQIIELMNLNVPFDDAQLAVAYSINSTQKINYNMDMEEAVQCLVSNGFNKMDAMNAIVSAKYDIKNALEILVQNTDTELINHRSQNSPMFAHLNQDFMVTLRTQFIKAASQVNQRYSDQNEQSNGGCGGDVGSMKQCDHLLFIINTLKKYNSFQHDTELDIISALNSFHHLLNAHDGNQQFEEIYHILNEEFGNCDVLKCHQFRRIRRERNKENCENDMLSKEISFIDDIIDKMHCYYQHSYDMGFRLTPNERKKIGKIDVKTENENEADTLCNKKLDVMLKVIKAKRDNIKQIIRDKSYQKFIATQVSMNNYETFCFGKQYVYWKFSEAHKFAGLNRTCYENCYIFPKFLSLKEELISNPFSPMAVEQFNNEYNKAMRHKHSHIEKKLIADPEVTKFLKTGNVFGFFHDGRIIGIKKGSEVGIHHLLAVILYCGYDNISYEFSKTYRALERDHISDDNDWEQYEIKQSEQHTFFSGRDFIAISGDAVNSVRNMGQTKEGIASIKGRHCKFYHLAKSLNELIHVYSPRAMDVNRYSIYHGINKKMKFIAMRGQISHPLSTTSSLEVAVQFSTNYGMVIQLQYNAHSRFFDCAWLSDFPNEREFLFINHPGSFSFKNIIDATTGTNYDEYVKGLCIIDSVVTACSFQPNNMVIQNNVERLRSNGVTDKSLIDMCFTGYLQTKSELESLGAKPIDHSLKMLTLTMIKHQLKSKTSHAIDIYIEELMDYICLNKTVVMIKWDDMQTEICNSYDRG
eukprot:367625_1